MANTVLNASIIAKESLAILDNELGWLTKLHRGYEDEFAQKVNGYKVGDTISIRRPHDPRPRTGNVMSVADVIEGKLDITVDTQVGHDFQFSSTDMTLKIDDLSERVIKPAMINIVNHIAADVMSTMYKGFYNWVGTPGQLVNSFADFAKAPERMDEMTIPQTDRCTILSPSDYWSMLGNQASLYIQGAANSAYRQGELGQVGGLDTYMSQLTPTHTVGDHGGTPLVRGADQNVTYDTAKNTWTQTLATDGWSTSKALKAGDVFTITGVYMVNARTKAKTTILQQFVITGDVTTNASGTSATNLTISPPIIISGPHQTVDAAPADDAPITMMGTAVTGYKQNLAFHKNAMALVVVPMEMPAAAYNGERRSHKGFSVRVIPVYDGTNDISKWRLDVLYGKKLIDPRLGLRYSGTS